MPVNLVALSLYIILDAEQVSTSSPLAALLADSTGLDAGGPQVREHGTIKQIQVWSSSAFSNLLTKKSSKGDKTTVYQSVYWTINK